MKILVAPQALKGSLDAPAVAAAIAAGLRRALPDVEIVALPIADGGEGTVEALVAATGGSVRHSRVTGPLGEPVQARFGLLGARADEDGPTAIIEMAAASGLPLVPEDRRDPRVTTTYGTGELMLAALEAGARHLLVGIGGSATNDGGAGMAQALGAHLLDAAGHELPRGGAALAHLARIDVAGLDPRLHGGDITVLSDVENPLCGPHGASAVFGPQKGATQAMVSELDTALAHYAAILRHDLGADVADRPGAGAAGGLGAGLMAFLGARLRPGAEAVLEAIGLAGHLAGAALAVALVIPDPTVKFQTLFDSGQAAAYMQLAAWELGVGSCLASIYEMEKARGILGFPADMYADIIISFGYPAEEDRLSAAPKKGGRKPLEEIVHWEKW